MGSVAKAGEGVQRGVSLARIQDSLRHAYLPENRSADAYRSEVEDYLALAGERLCLWALNGFEHAVDVPLSLQVVNSGERNLESVEITLSFSDPVLVWEESEIEMPTAPRAWGPRANPALGSSIRSADFDIRSILTARLSVPYISPGYTATTRESTVIEFRPFDLRPHKEYQLPEVPLVVGMGATGSIEGSWSATAKNRDGRGEGVLTVLLSESVVSIDELVAAQQEN